MNEYSPEAGRVLYDKQQIVFSKMIVVNNTLLLCSNYEVYA